jgi:hypothetical protein
MHIGRLADQAKSADENPRGLKLLRKFDGRQNIAALSRNYLRVSTFYASLLITGLGRSQRNCQAFERT